MKILKSNLLKGIMKLGILYKQFDEQIEKYGCEKIVEEWSNTFNEIEFDYKEANTDFISAISKISTESKFPPTIADIVTKMRELNINRKQNEEFQYQIDISKLQENTAIIGYSDKEKALELYKKLLKKYSEKEVEDKLIKIQNENSIYSYDLTLALERILENE